ncbi:hypothetical protein B4113_2490 [Geobacillus sp. B4113_201601]|nr:hypothetical protein B4113_2490 [Geobacillus sp. B4113_201601]
MVNVGTHRFVRKRFLVWQDADDSPLPASRVEAVLSHRVRRL